MRPILRTLLLSLVALAAIPLTAGRAAACARLFVVFFPEPGSTNIPPVFDARIGAVVNYYTDRREWTEVNRRTNCGPLPPGDWKIVLLAHADDPGTRDPCALSLLRGHAVRARLAALGIPEASIAVEAFGDRSKLVPTPRGRSDAQNRRVELIVVDSLQVVDRSSYTRMRDMPAHACPERR